MSVSSLMLVGVRRTADDWEAVSQECGSERGRADQFCVHTHAHTHGAARAAERRPNHLCHTAFLRSSEGVAWRGGR